MQEVTPWPGKTFIIKARDSPLTITVVDGTLQLQPSFSSLGGYHWACEEKDGWLGFRNCVSGNYIGHDSKGKFIANVKHHRDHEYFGAQRHPEGGYILQMRHGNVMRKMAIAVDQTLIETKDAGTRWDFLQC